MASWEDDTKGSIALVREQVRVIVEEALKGTDRRHAGGRHRWTSVRCALFL